MALYLLVALAWSWPLVLHLANRFTHDPGDPLLVTYLIWWNAHALPLTRAWWNAPYFWPMPNALTLTEHVAGLSPFTTPIQWLGGTPLLAYNLMLIASTWWSGLATHGLVKRLTGDSAAAYCAGLAFAYAPYRTSQLAHLQLYACWWLPLTLLALHAYYDRGRVRWLFVAAVAWLLQGLTNGYFLFFLPVLIGCWLAWFTKRPQRGYALRVIAALAVAAVLMLPFLLRYLSVQTAQGLARSVREMRWYSGYAGAFFSAVPLLRFWHTSDPRTTEQYLFPGITALTLVVVGAGVAYRDRRFQFYAGAAVLMTALCFGPAEEARSLASLWHPYTWLAWLPGFTGLRVPARFYMLAVLCLAVAAGIAASYLGPRGRWRGVLVGLILGGLVLDGTISGMPLGVPPGKLALPQRNARVLVLPFNDAPLSVFAMYGSTSHGLPVVNGYAGYVPRSADAVDWALGRRDPTILTALRRGHPLYVIVAPGDQADAWTTFINAQPGVESTGIQAAGAVYLLPAEPYTLEPRPKEAIDGAIVARTDDWLMAILPSTQVVRAVELRTYGDFVRLPASLEVQTSLDGATWTPVFDQRPGEAALTASLESAKVVPFRMDVPDVPARYVRVNAPGFRASAVTIYGPR